MKNKKQFTLIELIIVIVVIGILAGMALPKFNGVVRNAKLAAMINDKEVLEKTLVMYYQKNDELPLLNENQELIVQNEGISLSKIVLAEEAQNGDMDTIYKSLKETLSYYNDSEETLYRIDLPKIKDSLSKDIKYGHKKHDKDFYVYSLKTGNVYYYDYLVNGNGTIQHTEYDTLLKDNELITKVVSPPIKESNQNNEDNKQIQHNTITLGNGYSMKIGEDGNIYSWGYNASGRLGLGNTNEQLTPQKVILPNGEKPISINAGNGISLALTKEGNVYGWGTNSLGQLCLKNVVQQLTPTKINFPNNDKIISLYTGNYHNMAITDKGELYAFGYNSEGQLGTGNINTFKEPTLITLPNNEKPIDIYLGFDFSMVKTDRNFYSWGKNDYGQLGVGDTRSHVTPELVVLPNNEKIVDVSLGLQHSLCISDKGNLYAWGKGDVSLSDNKYQTTPKMITLPNEEKPISIKTGNSFSAILSNKNNLYVYGFNASGGIGLGNTNWQKTLANVTFPNNEKPVSIYSGGTHLLAKTDKGNTYVWGQNNYGQLGIGNKIDQLIPVKVDLP